MNVIIGSDVRPNSRQERSQDMSQSSTADSQLVSAIVQTIKSRGIFDDFRRQCLSDTDTKPSFQNLLQRVEGYVSKFVSQQKWNQNINKNQLRERLRKQINESGMLKYGIEHLVEQVVSYKINSLFWPKIEDVVKEFLGIVETPPIEQQNVNQSNDNSVKSVARVEPNIDEKAEPIIKEETVDNTYQPMDIETDSNSSNYIKPESIDHNLNADSCEGMDWPTPPKPEMITPERQQIKDSPKDVIQSNDDSTNFSIKKEIISESDIDIKVNETFMINKSVMNELKSSKTKVEKLVKTKNEVKTEELSDVSSVHTSDLSDFDDEISLDDSNDEREDNKKKKISLKVAKKITEVLSSEQSIGSKHDSKHRKESPTELQNTEDVKSQSEAKRVRKVNPRYSSKEFSSIFNRKDRSVQSTSKEMRESPDEQIKSETEHKIVTRKRRPSNGSDDTKESNEVEGRGSKTSKRSEEMPIDSRCSSRGSIESSFSETTQDSMQSQKRPQRKRSKTRNELQTQRYESSDLYKPRPIISSRRPRAPTTPDSSNQSNEEFFVHDLSK